jgi:hypothetical protein
VCSHCAARASLSGCQQSTDNPNYAQVWRGWSCVVITACSIAIVAVDPRCFVFWEAEPAVFTLTGLPGLPPLPGLAHRRCAYHQIRRPQAFCCPRALLSTSRWTSQSRSFGGHISAGRWGPSSCIICLLGSVFAPTSCHLHPEVFSCTSGERRAAASFDGFGRLLTVLNGSHVVLATHRVPPRLALE